METETQNLQLATRCEQRSTPSDSSNLEKLIREWIVRFALNAGIALDASAQANYRTLWLEGFSDLAPDRLQAAFVACMRSHQFAKMPTAADVRSHLSKAEENAAVMEAEAKWKQVLRYIESTSPDYPSRQKISERTMTAIRAAGGIPWIRECPLDQLVWCKKQFIESYLRWQQLEQEQFLLPDGPIKDIIRALADGKQRQLTEGRT